VSKGVNKFGNLSDLGNEATVEQFFANRLLSDLGYKDSQIKPKASLSELVVSKGRKSEKWRPDYAIEAAGTIRWIVEAKGVEEDLDKWVQQASSYCLALNSSQETNPVEYFVLTNGVSTRLYRWDDSKPLVEANFRDFVDGNQSYAEIRRILNPNQFAKKRRVPPADPARHVLRRHSVSDLNADFAWAHTVIYKRDNLSYTAAFMEFVKVIFLKLNSDREAHASLDIVKLDDEAISVPVDDVKFSTKWILSREKDTPSPLDSILFQNLLATFEMDVAAARKKRIFPKGERLLLSPETLKVLVDRLESVDLISIDADLNGRMFETFLNSTLRGKALGQYFTPRSVVKLATGLARLRADDGHVDRVIDACSGTGGFLIEALADMTAKVNNNRSLSEIRKEELRTQIAQESLIGIDVARDPALARIARINMFLHGDGGTSIFQLDSLDKNVAAGLNEDPELVAEKNEFRSRIAANGSAGIADVALTNPPFAKEYSRDQENEAALLDEYVLSIDHAGGAARKLKSLTSMVMFLERYYDFLAPGGRLITVLDDSILAAPKHARVRSWIRENWIIKGVVSLPGDAFQRSQARVKTSLLLLEKRRSKADVQPDVFMYYCSYVGVDDPSRQRLLPVDEHNRRHALAEIERVIALYDAFERGSSEADEWIVSAQAVSERFDVKHCLPEPEARVADWVDASFEVVPLSELADLAIDSSNESERVIETGETDEVVNYLRVRYDGFCESGDEAFTGDLPNIKLTRVEEGDIVFSHINAIHGAVGIVPAELAGYVVTNEYTVCRANERISASVLWTILRSNEARAELILLATGIGRTRVKWSELRELKLPLPGDALQSQVTKALQEASEAEDAARNLRREATELAARELLLDSQRARTLIAAFKPPR